MLKPTTTAPPTTPSAPDVDAREFGDDGSDGFVAVSSAVARPGRYRAHARPGRTRQVRLRYSDREYESVARAAHAAGLTTTGYVAEAALAAAGGAEPPTSAPWRAALTELMAARAQVRRIGLNINQAARILNAAGEPPAWLEHALALTERAITGLDDAATVVADLARQHGARTTGHPSRPIGLP